MKAVKERLKDLTRPTSEDDTLRVDYPPPRFEVTTRALVMVTVVAVVGISAFALILFSRTPLGSSGPAPAEIPQAFEQQASVDPRITPTEVPGGEIVVSVVGEVATPGLYTFVPGARVADALAAAGSAGIEPSAQAARAGVNLAERLVDAQQIYVPAQGEGLPQAGAGPEEQGKVNLNKASASELETLDGVGAKTAQAIIAHREAAGGFSSVEQLMEVKGIGPAKYEAMKDQVTV